MIIYNVTLKINNDIQQAWQEWMLQEHIPDVLSTGCFTKAVLHRLLEIDEADGPTFSAQYTANDIEQYRKYIQEFAPAMRQKLIDKWGNGFIAFRSVMEVVN